MYYVYEYYIKSTGVVFYVGKGKNYRYNQLNNRNKSFLEIYNNNECDVRFVKENMTNQEALQLEQERISELKQINQAQCNFVDGGIEIGTEGVKFYGEKNGFYGRKHTEDTKKKISQSKVGCKGLIGKDNPMYGKGLKGEDNPMYGKKGLFAPNKRPYVIIYIDGTSEIMLYKECEKKFGIAFIRVSKNGGVLEYKKKCKADIYEGTQVKPLNL